MEMGGDLPMQREDYLRWLQEQRNDILQYASIPQVSDGWGELWIDPKTGQELLKCPFLTLTKDGKCLCSIEDTKPMVCREFWCEYAFGVGDKGIKCKSLKGWSSKAREIGYGK